MAILNPPLLIETANIAQGYPTGVTSVMAFNAFQIVSIVALRFFYVWRNKQADAGKIVIEGDADFRYSL